MSAGLHPTLRHDALIRRALQVFHEDWMDADDWQAIQTELLDTYGPELDATLGAALAGGLSIDRLEQLMHVILQQHASHGEGAPE